MNTINEQVTSDGYLTDPQIFTEQGEYSLADHPNGEVYIPDGEIIVFNTHGERTTKVIHVPERPACVIFAGKDHKTLLITARKSFYKMLM